jgi:DNA-binding HxlR family transcriptional regulator
MVEDGILTKQAFNELPPRVEYTLTELGEKLVAILWQLNDWGKLLIPRRRIQKFKINYPLCIMNAKK